MLWLPEDHQKGSQNEQEKSERVKRGLKKEEN